MDLSTESKMSRLPSEFGCFLRGGGSDSGAQRGCAEYGPKMDLNMVKEKHKEIGSRKIKVHISTKLMDLTTGQVHFHQIYTKARTFWLPVGLEEVS